MYVLDGIIHADDKWREHLHMKCIRFNETAAWRLEKLLIYVPARPRKTTRFVLPLLFVGITAICGQHRRQKKVSKVQKQRCHPVHRGQEDGLRIHIIPIPPLRAAPLATPSVYNTSTLRKREAVPFTRRPALGKPPSIGAIQREACVTGRVSRCFSGWGCL